MYIDLMWRDVTIQWCSTHVVMSYGSKW